SGGRRRVRPALPLSRLLHGGGQVRARAAAEPRPAARHRRGRARLAAEDRHGQRVSGPRARPRRALMRVADALGAALVAAGIDHVFGVVGSGNFRLTNAMIAAGATFVAARHEGGAATMADAYARTSGSGSTGSTVAAVSVHQGCGYTNDLTGIAEAAK